MGFDDFESVIQYRMNFIGISFVVNEQHGDLLTDIKHVVDDVLPIDNCFHFGTFVSGSTYSGIIKKYNSIDYAAAIVFPYHTAGSICFVNKSISWGEVRILKY